MSIIIYSLNKGQTQKNIKHKKQKRAALGRRRPAASRPPERQLGRTASSKSKIKNQKSKKRSPLQRARALPCFCPS
jgi:hypothetical protein